MNSVKCTDPNSSQTLREVNLSKYYQREPKNRGLDTVVQKGKNESSITIDFPLLYRGILTSLNCRETLQTIPNSRLAVIILPRAIYPAELKLPIEVESSTVIPIKKPLNTEGANPIPSVSSLKRLLSRGKKITLAEAKSGAMKEIDEAKQARIEFVEWEAQRELNWEGDE